MLEAIVFIRKNIEGLPPGVFVFFHAGDEFLEAARFVNTLSGQWEDRYTPMPEDAYKRVKNNLLDENSYPEYWTITLKEKTT